MSDTSVELLLDAEGKPMLRKSALTPAGVLRLRHEATALSRARHPAVVSVAEQSLDGPHPRLDFRWAGSHSLATIPLFSVEHAAGMVAAVATTVADLHEVGVVHGRLSADHVVVGEGGRPLLCGFAEAVLAGEPPNPRPQEDVADLGRLLHRLIAAELETELIPEGHRWRLRRQRRAGFQRRSLLTLADQASADEASARPTARALAASIRQAVPHARLQPSMTTATHPTPTARLTAVAPPNRVVETDPHTDQQSADTSVANAPEARVTDIPAADRSPDQQVGAAPGIDDAVRQPTHERSRERVGRRVAVVFVTAATVAVLALGVQQISSALERSDPGDTRSVDRSVVPRVTTRASRPQSQPTPPSHSPDPPAGPAPPSASCPATPAPRADVDNDGCAETLRVDGTSIIAGSLHFSVGLPGDVIVLGDWACNGSITPAVARPVSQEVFVFSDWAEADNPLTVRPIATGTPAHSGQAVDADGDGCDDLMVTDPSGETTVIDLRNRP